MTDLPALKGEIERRIGRNLLLYQQIEMDLKWLDRFSRVSGTISELPEKLAEAHKRSKGNPMGGAITRFLKQAESKLSHQPADLKEDALHLELHWSIEESELSRQDRKKRIERVRDDRNELAHGLLSAYDLASHRGCECLLGRLESAHESALRVARELEGIRATAELVVRALKVPEFRELIADPQAGQPDRVRISGDA